jgi:hypothetical protein
MAPAPVVPDERAREMAVIDEELARLAADARTTGDAFQAALDWAQIDSLLERRHALMTKGG